MFSVPAPVAPFWPPTRMRYVAPGVPAKDTDEPLAAQPVVLSLQAMAWPEPVGHAAYTASLVSKLLPQVEIVTGPSQVPLVKLNQMSPPNCVYPPVAHAPGSATPSVVAPVESKAVGPATTGSGLVQASFGGRNVPSGLGTSVATVTEGTWPLRKSPSVALPGAGG